MERHTQTEAVQEHFKWRGKKGAEVFGKMANGNSRVDNRYKKRIKNMYLKPFFYFYLLLLGILSVVLLAEVLLQMLKEAYDNV